jgi:hypothetical protein
VTRYEHTQTGYALICGLFVAAFAFAFARFFQTSPQREIFLVVSILFLITIVAFYKLTITIDGEILCASFGVGLARKKVALAEIAAFEPIRIRWWYGWGIHLTPYGWLFNVAGLDAVAITLHDGRKFALGTDDPDGLVAAIRRFGSVE